MLHSIAARPKPRFLNGGPMPLPTTNSAPFIPSRFLKNQLLVIAVGASFTVLVLITSPNIGRSLLSANFLPHAYCYLKNPALVWTHVIADSFIALSYLAISVTLGHLGYKGRRDIPYHWMFLAFGLFILGCGGTHLVEGITVWVPVYVLAAAVKVFTAAVSLTTAAVLPFTVPHVFELIHQAKATEQRTAELRASEERKDALLQEVHHRVKNNLAVICSLFYLESIHSTHEETAEIFRDMENRVHSMALVHESLYGAENLARIDFAENARNLAQDILASHGSPSVSVRLKTELEPVTMAADLAVPCGLILNELISNAFKHGFPGGTEGEIKLTLRGDAGGRYTLCVQDTGVGIPAGLDCHSNQSLGLKLVRLLTQQIRGSFELMRSDPGTIAHLRFEVSQNAC
jgi:two-component sensor histidine kinase